MKKRSFEDARAWLNHDRMKNEFLVNMGYNPSDEESPSRFRIMKDALKGDDRAWGSLGIAAELWPSLAEDILEFLNGLRAQYGYVLTDKYATEKKRAVEALDSLSGIMKKVASRKLGEGDIEPFWREADVVRKLLENMSKHRHFGDYVLDIDLGLLRKQRDE